MDLLLAPIYSFFSVPFYKRVLWVSFGKGFLYLSMLSTVYGVLFVLFLFAPFRTQADQFVDWFTKNLPELSFTKDGVQLNVEQPFEMKNPAYGSVLVIDTTRTDLEKMPSTVFYLTKTKLVFRNEQRGEYRVFKLAPESEEAKSKWKDFVVTGSRIQSWYQKLMPFVYPVLFTFVFLFFLIWKIFAALFYSLIALILNLFRKQKLNYASLLVCSIFALTPVTVLQWASIFIPRILPALNFFMSLLLTTLYLALGILATQEKEVPDSGVI